MGFRQTSFQIGGHSLPPSSGGNSVDWLGHLPVCRQDSIPRPTGRLSVPTRFLVACCVVWRLRVLLPGATNFPGLNTPTIHYRRPPQVYPHSMLASVTSLRYSLPRRPSPPCLQCRRSFRGVGAPGGGWGQLCVVPERTRRAANRHRVKAPRYVCGQKVWLSTQNLPLQVSSRKLMPRFIGPFSIVKVLSPVAVKLRLSNQLRRVHPVFHVSCIKPVIRFPPVPPVHLLPLMRGLPFTGYGGCLTFVLGGGATSFWWIGRGTVLRRGGGSRPGTSWIARSSTISTVLVSLLLRERLEALVEGGVLSWAGFVLSLSLSLSPGPCLSILPHLFIIAISACAASLSHLFSLVSLLSLYF